MDWKKVWTEVGEMLTSFLRSALAAAIALILAQQQGILDFTGDQWKMVANAAIAAGLVTVYIFLDPKDNRYGIGSTPEPPAQEGDA